MSVTITQFKDSIKGLNRGASIDDISNFYELLERAQNIMLAKADPIETVRLSELTNFVHDDLQDYPLPLDYKKLIDIAPVEDRQTSDRAERVFAEPFAAELEIRRRQITIEAKEGTKYIRINWKENTGTTLHTLDSLTANGTIAVVGSATGLKINEQYKLSGSASVQFNLVATGDGIQCAATTTQIDVDDWDELADIIVPVYLPSTSGITSFTFIFGNDLTTNYWTTTAVTTQADGTAFRVGWNWLIFKWSTATETGTVDPAKIDAFRLTIAATAAKDNIRVDKIVFSLGRIFDVKYYSQYIFKNSAGTWISIPTVDGDTIVLLGTALEIYKNEALIQCFKQLKVSLEDAHYKATADDLKILYQNYKGEHPSESKRAVARYSGRPRWTR